MNDRSNGITYGIHGLFDSFVYLCTSEKIYLLAQRRYTYFANEVYLLL